MNFRRTLGIFLGGFLLILSYQNCSKNNSDVQFTQQSSKSSVQTDNGHGLPYDGKIYLLIGDLCPDNSHVRGRIVVKNPQSAMLERENCNEIAPVALAAADFRINPLDAQELTYKEQIYVNEIIGNKLDMTKIRAEIGPYSYTTGTMDFGGIPSDYDTAVNVSTLQLYENGKPLGPAHSFHIDIREKGLGRFSHWKDELRFSSSDNTSPLTNGRVYSWTAQ